MVAVNLLPWRQLHWQRQRRQSFSIVSLLLSAIVLLVALQAWRTHSISQAALQQQETLRTALDEIAQRLTLQKQAMQRLATQQKRLDNQQIQIQQLARWQQFWLDLPALLPDTLWLQRLEKRELQLFLEGHAQDMQAIRAFRHQLANYPLFTLVQQGSVKRQSEGHYRFSLRAQLQEITDE